MFVLGGDWQNTRAGASGDCVVTIPVLALVEYPEKGSKAAEKMRSATSYLMPVVTVGALELCSVVAVEHTQISLSLCWAAPAMLVLVGA